jgi:hypothetical protein
MKKIKICKKKIQFSIKKFNNYKISNLIKMLKKILIKNNLK